MRRHVAHAQSEPLEAERDRGGWKRGLILGGDKLPVLGEAELRTNKVASDEERMGEHLEDIRRGGQCCLLLVLAETVWVLLHPRPVIQIPAEPDESQTEDTLRHRPANVIFLLGNIPEIVND